MKAPSVQTHPVLGAYIKKNLGKRKALKWNSIRAEKASSLGLAFTSVSQLEIIMNTFSSWWLLLPWVASGQPHLMKKLSFIRNVSRIWVQGRYLVLVRKAEVRFCLTQLSSLRRYQSLGQSRPTECGETECCLFEGSSPIFTMGTAYNITRQSCEYSHYNQNGDF